MKYVKTSTKGGMVVAIFSYKSSDDKLVCIYNTQSNRHRYRYRAGQPLGVSYNEVLSVNPKALVRISKIEAFLEMI